MCWCQRNSFSDKDCFLDTNAFNYGHSPSNGDSYAPLYGGGSLSRIVFRNGINADNVSKNAMWACDAVLIGDATVQQAAHNMASSIDFDPDTCYLNPDFSQATLSIADQMYTGSPITPAVAFANCPISLTEGTDYVVSFADNVDVGQAKVTVVGKGEFSGNAIGTFAITKADIIYTDIPDLEPVLYVGKPCTPKPTITWNGKVLEEGTDYTLSYAYNDYPSSIGYAVITGMGNYTGSATALFDIEYNNIQDAVITIPEPVVFPGEPCTPKPLVVWNDVTLQEGVDYTLRYEDNKLPGNYGCVYVTGVGSYIGETWKMFYIDYPNEDNSDSNREDDAIPDDSNKPSDGSDGDSNGSDSNSNVHAGSWLKNSTGWWYRYDDGSYPWADWRLIDGAWYYFNIRGYMQTGWLKYNDLWYYL